MQDLSPGQNEKTEFTGDVQYFRQALLSWFAVHKRDLPWRRTKDPYAIWVSEIMLQQTRVAAVIPYYEKFLKRFPDYSALAEASEPDLLAHWAGLGYYHRARNLQKAAQQMQSVSAFPASYEQIRALPGIGDYTSAAIASIGFGFRYPVLDGNVFRVLSRLANDTTNIKSPKSRPHFARMAHALLDPKQPGDFNQALMELGATICLPRNPQCLLCPVAFMCKARAAGTQDRLPVNETDKRSVREDRTLFWIERNEQVLAWQRPPEAHLMPGFWELPERTHLPHACASMSMGVFRHGITFHSYRFEVAAAEAPLEIGACQWIALNQAAKLPMSTIFRKAYRTVQAHRRVSPLARAAASGGSERS
jgi:A/G-specific adenine glycosylase